MSSSRSDPGATLAARGQPRATPLARAQASLPGPLGRVPIAALAAWAGVFAIALVVLIAPALRSADAIEKLEEDEITAVDASTGAVAAASATSGASAEPEPPKPPKVTKAELDGARLAGAEALAQLAQRFPEDANVLRELFLALATDKKSAAAALRAAKQLFEAAPEAGDDDDVRRALLGLANGSAETAALALDVIAHEMGARGPELLFEVASSGAPLSRIKAATLLTDPEVRKLATPALLIASDLRGSLPCARKALLARARTDGDARSLPFLKPLVNTACGGLFRRGPQCFACISPQERADIQAIIDAIQGHQPGGAATATPDGG